MEQQGTHYRVGGKLTHAGCEMLPDGKDIPYIVIERIEFLPTLIANGQTKENGWQAHFAKNPYTTLPMMLNATNRKRIAKRFPDCNGMIDLLKNIPVRLTREVCRDPQDGGDTWGLRISKTPAKVPEVPKLTKDSDKMTSAIEFLKNGGKIEDIKKKYEITKETEEWMLGEIKG